MDEAEKMQKAMNTLHTIHRGPMLDNIGVSNSTHVDPHQYTATLATLDPNSFKYTHSEPRKDHVAKKSGVAVLVQAHELIYGDREKSYGSPAPHFDLVAKMWGAYLEAKFKGVKLDAADVIIMMALLKIGRLAKDPSHRDSQVDAAGYMGLLERLEE